MAVTALALLAGMLLTARLPALPPLWLILTGLAVGVAGLVLRPARLPAVALAGAAWFALHAHWQLADRLPAADDRLETTATFVIEDFPRRRGRAVTFVARGTDPALPERIRLNWYEPDTVPRIGERWRFTVVLRAPRGLVNPGGFDYERWLFTRGIGATGYVRGEGRRLGGPGPRRLAWWRSRLESALAAVLPNGAGRGVMVALATGSRHRLDAASTELFQATGTSHLMAISGLHVGLVAGLVFALAGRSPGVGGRDRAALLALAAATVYGLLAGFGTPVRRALLMLGTVVLAGRWRRPLGPVTGLALALIVVLLVQPLDCLTPGFAMSFGAVAAIIAIAGSDAARGDSGGAGGKIRTLASLQWRLWVLLAPLTLLFFDRIAWSAIPANLVAIPAFGLFVVPATLAGGVAAAAGGVAALPAAWLLALTHAALDLVLDLLQWLATLPGAGYRPPGRGPIVIALATVATLSLLLPRCLPGRWIPVWLTLSLLLWRGSGVPPGCVRADVLDVGQGLAVVVRTRHHAMLYDAGPAYASGSDAGERVVVPALRTLGVRRLDLLMLSHADNDHAGGAASVAAAVPVAQVASGEPGELAGVDAAACERGGRWSWDGIGFRVLWPAVAGAAGNDGSCVLEVSAGERRLLLPGDIERDSERRLLAAGGLQRADVVLMPHHGSATSSSAALVDALRPRVAIATAAWRNRWGFPRPEVARRWQAGGARVMSTGDYGALAITLCSDDREAQMSARRDSRRRLWSPAPPAGASGPGSS
ncbi:DNA internalization-related competence protein ComEC/Rec2 [Lentisalinibacter sediminis]|uniref:DNA internalization-related competence protein ComEC/Rec2 n=1 Tax=Lentisalinibacter sediminis TaxID=2992237 RepID=UPI0038699993